MYTVQGMVDILTKQSLVIYHCIIYLDLANAATKIQANFRGHIARKQVGDEVKKGDDLAKEMDKLKTVSPTHVFQWD